MAEKTVQNIKNKTYNISNIQAELQLEKLGIDNPKVQNIVREERNFFFFFPTDWSNLSEHIYFSSAYTKTKSIATKIIDGYPLGKNGNIVNTWESLALSTISAGLTSGYTDATTLIQDRINETLLWQGDIEEALLFYNNLTFYEQWVVNQLAGATVNFNPENTITGYQTYKQPTFTITGYYVASTSPLTATVSAITEDKKVVLPVILRDFQNNLIPPFGAGYSLTPDYHDDLVGGFGLNQSLQDASFYEILMTTALAFDEGIHFALTNRGGTGDHDYVWTNYDGDQQSRIYPDTDKYSVNRPVRLTKLVPSHLLSGDNEQIVNRFLEVMASMMDDTKLYIDNLTNMFKNYWSNWDKIPRGLVQKIVAFQLGSELFSSSNNGISDLVLRGKRSVSDITYEFWNRILCTLVYAYKTKGTIESIKSIVRAYGFPESMMEVEELCYKYTSFTHTKYDVQSTHVARFGDTLSADLYAITGSSISSLSSSDSFHMSFRIRNRLGQTNDTWKSIFTNGSTGNQELSISIKTDVDSNNANNTFNSFLVNCDGASITTNYDFWNNVAQNDNDRFVTLAVTRAVSSLTASTVRVYAGHNFESVYFSESLTSVTSSSSLSSYTHSLSAFTIGDVTTPPIIYLQEFLIDKNEMTNEQFMTRSLNFENFSNIDYAEVESIVFHYKMKENVDYSIAGKDYIIDSSLNGTTGVPITNAVTMIDTPYQFFDDMFKNIRYRDVGFNIPITTSLEELTSEDIKRKNLRIGMSVARTLNEDIENYLGDVEISDLMFDPVEYFNERPSFNNLEYTNLELKKQEVFDRYQETFKPWKFTTFIERIEGHLGSFFSFIKQFVPIKEKVVSKGIIYEDYSLARTRLRKPWISTPADLVLSVLRPINISIVTNIIDNPMPWFEMLPTEIVVISLNNIINLSSAPTLTVGESMNYSMNMIGAPAMSTGVLGMDSTRFNVNIGTNANVSTPIASNNLIIKHVGHGSLGQHIASIPIQGLKTKRNDFSNIQFLTPSSYNPSMNSDYTLQISFQSRDIFIATAYTEDESIKTLEGTIYLNSSRYDTLSEFQYPNKEVIKIDTSEMKDGNNINRLRLVIDGKEVNRSASSYTVRYPVKGGIKFKITSIGSISEGLPVDQEVKIKFINLVNSQDEILVLNFYVGLSMQEFTNSKGYSLTTNVNG